MTSIEQVLSFVYRQSLNAPKPDGALCRLALMEAVSELGLSFPLSATVNKKTPNDLTRLDDVDYNETNTDPAVKDIHLTVPADMTYITLARLVVAGIGASLSLSIDTIEDLKIALTEALSNVVKHAYPENRAKGKITIWFSVSDHKLLMDVKDTGMGFNNSKLKYKQIPSSRGQGLGLFLIKSLMDEVGLYSTIGRGTEVKMVKFLTHGKKACA